MCVHYRFIFRCYGITLQQRELRTVLQVLQRISLHRYFYVIDFYRTWLQGVFTRYNYRGELQDRITEFIYTVELQGHLHDHTSINNTN